MTDEGDPLGARLRRSLEQASMSQNKLAEKIGVSAATVSLWIKGERTPPTERIPEIARAVGVDSNFLTGVYQERELRAAPDFHWEFRETVDGGRDYGNSNVFATPPDLPTLVRESGQNSTDQRVHASMHLRYTLIELTKGSVAYTEFLELLRFDKLREHLGVAAATDSRLGNKLKTALGYFDKDSRLFLLRIDDFGTTGLYGAEWSGGGAVNPFAALVRNNLDSSKTTQTAGGSFGLGKATIWLCSSLSLALFSSRVAPAYGEDREELRFIGKSELTWHELGGKAFAGPGWLGQPNKDSAWIAPAALKPLYLDRTDLPEGVSTSTASGTSALIVGFRDPRSENAPEADHLLAELRKAAAQNFWPAIVDEDLKISVGYVLDGDRKSETFVSPDDSDVAPFVRALRAHRHEEVASQPEPGETMRRTFKHFVPGTRPEASSVEPGKEGREANALLLVRLAHPDELGQHRRLQNSVALVRGRRMVVQYWERKSIVVGARPFHAVLLAGEAVAKSAPQTAAETFLRLAEPPAHDKWEFSEDLRDNYVRGGGQRLKELFEDATEQLRDLVRPDEDGQDDEPQALKRLLQLNIRQPEPKLAALRNIESGVVDGRWMIEGKVKILDKKRSFRVHVHLSVVPESGKQIPLPWRQLNAAVEGRGQVDNADDHSFIVQPRTTAATFSAESEASPEGLQLERCVARVFLRCEDIDTSVSAAGEQ